jgi:hypothetical protein
MTIIRNDDYFEPGNNLLSGSKIKDYIKKKQFGQSIKSIKFTEAPARAVESNRVMGRYSDGKRFEYRVVRD